MSYLFHNEGLCNGEKKKKMQWLLAWRMAVSELGPAISHLSLTCLFGVSNSYSIRRTNTYFFRCSTWLSEPCNSEVVRTCHCASGEPRSGNLGGPQVLLTWSWFSLLPHRWSLLKPQWNPFKASSEAAARFIKAFSMNALCVSVTQPFISTLAECWNITDPSWLLKGKNNTL